MEENPEKYIVSISYMGMELNGTIFCYSYVCINLQVSMENKKGEINYEN